MWEKIAAYAGEPFATSGRGKQSGIQFAYRICGDEMSVSACSKSIIGSMVLSAYRKVKNLDEVHGSKAIGVHGDLYISTVFKKIGMIG